MATLSDYLKLHFIVFLWGFTAIAAKLMTIPAVEMVLYRTLLAAIGMAIVIIIARGSFRVTVADAIRLLLTGLIVGIHWLTFFGSGQVSNPSTSLVGSPPVRFGPRCWNRSSSEKKFMLWNLVWVYW